MVRRSKKPIFIDEPIQWHLSTSKHDRCPACGMMDVGYLGKTERTCMNSICGICPKLTVTSAEWYREKMLGETADDVSLSRKHWLLPPDEDDGERLRVAWERSSAGLASISRKDSWASYHGKIYWREGDPWPFFYEHGKEKQACEPGSPLWILLAGSYWWQPTRKLSPLELLAQQAPRVEDIKERFLVMS